MKLRRPHSLRDDSTAPIAIAYIALAVLLGTEGGSLAARVLGATTSPIASDSATAILSAIASGMMALTAILFSLLFVAIQVSGSFFSPRLERLLGGTRFLGHALGVFGGTFLYALLAIRTIDIGERSGINISVVIVAFAWLLGSITVLLFLLPHVHALSIAKVLSKLYEQTNAAATRVYAPARRGLTQCDQLSRANQTTGTIVRHHGPPLYLLGFDVKRLVRFASDADVVIHLPLAIGDPVMSGEPLASVMPPSRSIDEKIVRRALWLGHERVIDNDPAYGIRLLVDVAIRALSPAVNDPATAVMVLDQLDGLLRALGERDIEDNQVLDANGAVRLVYDVSGWDDLVALALTEIDQYGRESRQVQRRMAALVKDLEAVLPDTHRGAIARFAKRHGVVDTSQPFEADDGSSSMFFHDRQGLGHTVQRLAKTHQ